MENIYIWILKWIIKSMQNGLFWHHDFCNIKKGNLHRSGSDIHINFCVSLAPSLTDWLTYSLTQWLTCLAHWLIDWLTVSLTRSLERSLTHSPACPSTHPPTHPYCNRSTLSSLFCFRSPDASSYDDFGKDDPPTVSLLIELIKYRQRLSLIVLSFFVRFAAKQILKTLYLINYRSQ